MPKGRGSHFYQTEAFKRLHALWVTGKRTKIVREGKPIVVVKLSKLSKAGFQDIESPCGALKVKNIRTQAYRQQEDLARISSALSSYIQNQNVEISRLTRRILELHSQGVYRKEIMRSTGKSHQTVWKIIKTHIPLALGLYGKDEES